MEIHSPVKAWQEQQDLLNKAQKNDLKFQEFKAVKDLDDRVSKLEHKLSVIIGRLDQMDEEG